jgi:hypothetical protein
VGAICHALRVRLWAEHLGVGVDYTQRHVRVDRSGHTWFSCRMHLLIIIIIIIIIIFFFFFFFSSTSSSSPHVPLSV